ncbi:MAG: hypothetical protein Fur005_06550 [Roseiflexaceae bacterium]
MPDALLQVAARFTRAIHIQRDFHDLRHRLDGYQVTPLVHQTAGRVLQQLVTPSRERAFSVIGSFGTGKSAFGLFLAHFLQRREGSRRQLLDSLGVADPDQLLPLNAPTLLAVLVPGNNASLRHAILQQLRAALNDSHLSSAALDPLRQQIDAACVSAALEPSQVADLLETSARQLRAHGHFHGILVLIDELGQFLDYAARQEEERDLFVLQSLAEAAARSGDTPIAVVTILHQAFERYSLHAGMTKRAEWDKVHGRFADLPFQEPTSQMIRMVARALQPSQRDQADRYQHTRQQWATQIAPLAEQLGLKPLDINQSEWHDLIAASYPIHPLVLVALPTLFRQLAQNERSLFAFLHADEPYSLRDTLRDAQGDTLPIYRLTDLFGYVEANLGASLFGRARGLRWAELVEARTLLGSSHPLQQAVLTVVGTLGALDRSAGLRASQAQISLALRDTLADPDVAEALLQLQSKRMLTYRHYKDSYIIWEGSDLDLDMLTQQVRTTIGQQVALTTLLQRHADTTPRIARRHSYQFGATRTFAIRYVDLEQLTTQPHDSERPSGFDGELIHVVPADEEQLREAERWASDPARHAEPQRITVLPQRIRELRELLLDVAALRELLERRDELEHDRPARREVAGRLLEAQQTLGYLIHETYGGTHSRWFYRQSAQSVQNARQIDALLSAAADQTYPKAPRIWNELIMRRQISSAAAKARRNLVEAMLNRAHEPTLGFVGYPPERAIYESTIRAAGIHQPDDQGIWRIGPPAADDPLHLQPAWSAMEQFLGQESGDIHQLTDLFLLLEAPPYGLKAGIIPLLFMALYCARAGEMNIYERGNYVPLPDLATFERLLARPDQFGVRLSRADGARMAVYQRLARALAPRALQQPIQPALLTVAMPLLRLVNGLPHYSKQTKQLSGHAQAIRQAIREARAPDELLFERLPLACNLLPFRADQPSDELLIDTFASTLRQGLQELQDAYPNLLQRVAAKILHAFRLTSNGSTAHHELYQRYNHIAAISNDSQIRSLGVRLETADPHGNSWVESIAALVGKRTPESWNDGDIPAFEVAIADLGRRFLAAEDLAIAAHGLPAEAPLLRIGLAHHSGELSRVVALNEATPAMQQLQHELNATLNRFGDLSTDQRTAALAALLQNLLEPEQTSRSG